jgi:hypothetical protein
MKRKFLCAVYDFSNQLLKLLHKSHDDINSGNKKDESTYKGEAHNKQKI